MVTDFVCIKDGVVVLVDVGIEVIMDKSYKKFQDQYNIRITNLVKSFFALTNWEYGQTLRDSDIVKALSTIGQVSRYEINFVTNDPANSGTIVTTEFYEIIRPDMITVTFMYE